MVSERACGVATKPAILDELPTTRAAILRLIQLHETLRLDPVPVPIRPTAPLELPEQPEQPTRRAA